MIDEPYVITEAKQLRALASPVRSQIMEILRQGGERSVAEIAELVGATGPAMHYQIAQLVGVGLVVRAGKRRVGPRSESLYRAISRKIVLAAKPESAEYMKAMLAVATASIRRLEREVASAHQLSSEPHFRVIGRKGYIAQDDLPNLYALIEQAASLLRPAKESEDDEPLSLRAFTIKLPEK
jgi:DNA-binding transcriptional ArsR family regulator